MPTHRSFFALLLLASCGGELPPGPSPPPAPGLRDFEDGARLRGQFVGTVAGETQQVGIFDRSLGIACAFQPDQTERLRCLPPRSTGELFWSGYADAACTRALWYALSTLPDDAHLATVPVTGEKGFEVRPVERLTAPQVVFERSLGGGCGRAPDLMAGRAVLGPPVDPAMFVAARAAAPRPNPGRSLTTWQLEAEDGSRFQTGLFDLALGRACTPLRLDDQAGICLGGPLAWQGPEVFADDACSHSLVTGFPVHDQAKPVAYLDGDVQHAVGSR